jgi:hypothetical protein
MPQLWEEELDYVGEGRISIFTLRGLVLYGHKRTEKWLASYDDETGSRETSTYHL